MCLFVTGKDNKAPKPNMPITLPTHLQRGDLVHIVAPARGLARETLDLAKILLQKWGLRTEFGAHLFDRQNQFAGSDEARAADINTAIHDRYCKAIWCARGGYGSVRVLDLIDWAAFAKNPKWIAGYSDITAILHHSLAKAEVAGIHATMPVNIPTHSAESFESLRAALFGESRETNWTQHPANREGEAEGELVGGNLSVICSLLGSPSEIDTRSRILVLEDLDEYLYHIDRMMMMLKRAGKLEGLAGLIIGGMTDMHDNATPFGKTAEEIIRESVESFNFPVAFGFPSGHIHQNHAWVHGKKRRLTVKHDQPVALL